MTLLTAAIQRQGLVEERTFQKFGDEIRRWQRAGLPVAVKRIKTEHFVRFRTWGQDAKLSSVTIETTISDIVTLIGTLLPKTPPVGQRLKRRVKTKPVPTVDEFGAAYANAEQALWPNVWNSKTPELMQISNAVFWRGFLTLAYYTGLRMGDLTTIEWTAVQSDRIEWVAHKTGKTHVYPLPELVRKNIEPLRETGADRIFPVPAWAGNRIRRELSRISDGVIDGAQAIRRLAVTQWMIASPEGAGPIIHGTGLGVLNYYADKLRILEAASPRLAWPDEVLDHCGVSRVTERRMELNAALKRLPDDRIDDVLTVAKAFSR